MKQSCVCVVSRGWLGTKVAESSSLGLCFASPVGVILKRPAASSLRGGVGCGKDGRRQGGPFGCAGMTPSGLPGVMVGTDTHLAIPFRKVRQHVNPLSRRHATPTDWSPDWPRSAYHCFDQKFHLDIGSAGGRFCLDMAKRNPDCNFLGVEIREPMVERARARSAAETLPNVEFVKGNMNVDGEEILSRLPRGSLQTVSILFPDPWFKKRHHKRRVVQPSLVHWLALYMPNDGRVVLHTDVLEVAEQMRDVFRLNAYFVPEDGDQDAWVDTNVFEVASERERLVVEEGLPVYRKVYIRKDFPSVLAPE
mmetsp:Transcript_10640/g.21416  ORF Transcript_10640/g.21416 Transcript_10640/m.21416 type:complete len:308 (+) Transcript_10640:3420-4343(+)